jgi:hypothetical protein
VQPLKHPGRFLSIFAFALSVALLSSAGTAAAANPLLCFSGTADTANGGTGTAIYGGTCTLSPDGTSAVLNNSVTGPDGSYSGVYYAVSHWSGKLLSQITELSFNYAGTAVTPGSPRISLPVDLNNDGMIDYISIAAYYCNDGAGLVDPMHDTTCTIWSNLNGTTPLASNWAALVAAYPTLRVAHSVPFVIADDPGIWTVSNVQLGQGEAGGNASQRDACKKGGWANLTRADDTSFKNQGDCIQYVNTGK